MAINPHHLELFHYVVRFGGIAQASKHMPYGVGQSAISTQISRLEEHLGVTLFRRRPFQLTPEGDKLHRHTEGFFRTLDRIETELRGGVAPLLRIGATEVVQADHLPKVIEHLRAAHKDLRFSVRDARPGEFAAMVRTGELDLAICLVAEPPTGDLEFTPLMALKPVLLVPERHPARVAGDLLGDERRGEPLICLPPLEMPCVVFRAMLDRIGLVWEPAFELSSLPLVHRYVAAGYGVGLGVSVPGHPVAEGLREIALPDCASLTVGVLNNENPGPLHDSVMRFVATYVETLKSGAGA